MAGVPHGKTRPAPATVANRTGVEGTQNIRRKSVRGQGCPEKGVGHPSLPDHPRPYLALAELEGKAEKEGGGEGLKSHLSQREQEPLREEAQGPRASEPGGRPAHLHRRLHSCGRPGKAAKPQVCAWSIGGHLAQGKTPADSFQQMVLGWILSRDGPCKMG